MVQSRRAQPSCWWVKDPLQSCPDRHLKVLHALETVLETQQTFGQWHVLMCRPAGAGLCVLCRVQVSPHTSGNEPQPDAKGVKDRPETLKTDKDVDVLQQLFWGWPHCCSSSVSTYLLKLMKNPSATEWTRSKSQMFYFF